MTCLMPNQSAVRMIVPRFPGSWILSSTGISSPGANTCGNLQACLRMTANAWLGDFKLLMRLSSPRLTAIISVFCWICDWLHSIHSGNAQIISTGKSLPASSAIVFAPSATNNPWLSRYFFCCSDRINFICLALIILHQRYSKTKTLLPCMNIAGNNDTETN